MHTLQLRQKELKGKIKKWNKEEFGTIQKDQEKLQTYMKRTQQKIIEEGRTKELAQEEGGVLNMLEERRKQEENLWRQKSRAMQQHRQQNRIFSLRDNQGNRLTQKEEMEILLIQHFKGILTETQSNREEEIAKIIQYIPRRVN